MAKDGQYHLLNYCFPAPKLNLYILFYEFRVGTLKNVFLVCQTSVLGLQIEDFLHPVCFLPIFCFYWFLTTSYIFLGASGVPSVSAVQDSLQFSKTHKIRLHPHQDFNIIQLAISSQTWSQPPQTLSSSSDNTMPHGVPLPRVRSLLMSVFSFCFSSLTSARCFLLLLPLCGS